MTPVGAAMRWLKFHSQLKDGDAVIIGASSMLQVLHVWGGLVGGGRGG
jgi:hypothetical protein